ncbi:MAG: hypothetical protein ABH843_05315 [Candidatus Omnitrophota bacterium]
MKIIPVFFICAALVFNAAIAYSAPVGSTATPALLKSAIVSKDDESAKVGIIGGFEYDSTNDRKLNGQRGKTDLRFYDAKLGLVFGDRIFLYGIGGTGFLEAKFRDNGSDFKMETNTDLTWGVGANIVLYEVILYDFDSTVLRLGIDGKYRGTKFEIDRVMINEGTIYEIPNSIVTDSAIEYNDWQIAGAVSWQWKSLVPYAGIKYSDASGEMRTTVSGTKYQQDIAGENNLGVFLGAEYIIKDPITDTEAVSVNVEYRIIDEEALSLSCAVRF